jgi:hypothetical protein
MWNAQIGSAGPNSIGTAFGPATPNIKQNIYQIIKIFSLLQSNRLWIFLQQNL